MSIENIIAQQPYLETLWEASQAGLITWDSVQRYQDGLMPRCANHTERTAPANWEGVPLCVDCLVKKVTKVQIVEGLTAGAITPDEALAAWGHD